MEAIKSAVILGFCSTLSSALALADDVRWAQVHVVMHYQRAGTIATAQEGHFAYDLTATLDEVMQEIPSENHQPPSYVVSDDYAKSFSLSGTQELMADVTQTDKTTGQSYTATSRLRGSLTKPEEFWLEKVSANPLLGEGYGAELKVAAPLTGSFKSTYPQMPDVAPEEGVLLFPSPVKFDKDSAHFIAEGAVTIFPVLKKRPNDKIGGMIYDVAAGSEELPTLGGVHPPGIGAVTTGPNDHWTMTLKREKKYDTLVGGSYTDTIDIEISLENLTLPVPKALDPAKPEN